MTRHTKLFVLSILAMLATAAGLLLLIACLNHLAFFSRNPHIERVRRFACAPEYRLEVQRINADIREWRDYNRKWWLDWAIPDGWDDVPLIQTGDDLAGRVASPIQGCVR